MPPHTTQPPFAPGAQTQPEGQAEPAPPAGKTTHAMAERHEALWLALAALHKDVIALGAKKPGATVPEGLRVTVEGLLSDCAPFARRRGERLPVAAGVAARQGPPSDIPRAGGAPVPDSQADFGQGQQTYPRLRRLD